MQSHEREAFWKFFLTYFSSVAILVIAAGFFYFEQIRFHLLKAEEFSMLEYARHIKMGGPADEFGPEFSSRFVTDEGGHIDIRNFHQEGTRFVKLIPLRMAHHYLEVSKSTQAYQSKLRQLISRIVAAVLGILILFGFLSYRLAHSALKPLRESIRLLESFIKDLIHDLNTPLTAIKLNVRALAELFPQITQSRAYQRLQQSTLTVTELHSNLTILLEEKTFQTQKKNWCPLVKEIVEIHRSLYPSIRFIVQCQRLEAPLHAGAFQQILQNLLVNACEHNRPGGYVKISQQGKQLLIEDSGSGIEDPELIFQRNYSSKGSSGLGLDIVRRLCNAMQIDIQVHNNETGGSTFVLTLPQ